MTGWGECVSTSGVKGAAMGWLTDRVLRVCEQESA